MEWHANGRSQQVFKQDEVDSKTHHWAALRMDHWATGKLLNPLMDNLDLSTNVHSFKTMDHPGQKCGLGTNYDWDKDAVHERGT